MNASKRVHSNPSSMNRRHFLSVRVLSASAVALLLLPVFVEAAPGVPRIINTQGRLMNSSGTLLGGGGTEYCFKFSFYDSFSVGTKVWPSGAPSTMTVTVRNGIYSVGIGDTNLGGDSLDYNFQDSDSIFLNVEVATKVGGTCAGGDESFETLSPRQRIHATGYAINASMLGGYLAAQDATGNQIPVLSQGRLILGGTGASLNATSSNALTLQGGGAATGDIRFFSASNRITSVGNATFAGHVASLSASTTNASTSNLVISNSFTFANATGILKAVAGTVTAALIDLATDVNGILGIANGGTGTSTPPAYGQLLVGNALGGYDLIATSSLGINSGVWGQITGTLANQTDLQNALNEKFSLTDWFATTTAAKTFTANVFTALQSFTSATALDTIAVGRDATTTIRGEANATSTFAGSIDLANGCFAINGECITSPGGGGVGNGVLIGIQEFSSPGTTTYTPTAGATNAQVIITGAGGGGGGADGPDTTNETAGGGGGAGGTTVLFFDLNGTTSVQIVVGAGGSGGLNTGTTGNGGGHSAFSTVASSTGGVGGTGSAVNATGCAGANALGPGGTGGTGIAGNVNIPGGAGGMGTCAAEVVTGGLGGGSYWGGGGRGASDPTADGSIAGSNSSTYGAGGGGAADEDSATGAIGGNGGSGIIVVYEYGPFNGTMAVDDGGTGIAAAPTFGQILVGNGLGGYQLLATSSLNVSPNLGEANAWTGLQQFLNASSTQLSAYIAYFGATATTTIDRAGNVAVAGTLQASGQTTLGSASTTNISSMYASSTRGFFGTLSLGNLTGVLKATAGAVTTGFVNLASEVSGVLGIANGGTGTSTAPVYGQVLVGNASGGYDLVATSSLGITGDGGGTWGSITGTLSNQTDLQAALDAKLSLTAWYATTTDGLAQGVTNRYYNDSLVNSFLGASTTVAKTYASNTFIGANSFIGQTTLASASTTNISSVYASSTNAFFGSLSLGSLTGVLKANAGTVTAAMLDLANEVSGVLAIANGGTGTSTTPTYGQLLIGNAAGGYDLLATSTLNITLGDTTGMLSESRGGTGQTTYVEGDILYASADGILSRLAAGNPGTVLKISGAGVPFWGTDLSAGGGGGSGGAWATTTDNLAIYPIDTSKVVLVGTNATSSNTTIFEVDGRSYFSDKVGIGTTTAGTLFSIEGVGNFAVTGSTMYSDLTLDADLAVNNGLSVLGHTTLSSASTTAFTSEYASSTSGFFGSLSVGNLSGVLKAAAGAVTTGFVNLASEVTGILGIANGGTGTSTAPSYGQVLLGNAAGGYDLVATSSLGIAAGGTTWGSITGTLSNQTDLQNALNAKLSLAAWYATTTDALAQGATNRYYSDSLVNTFLGASTTIPKTFTANTFTNSNTFLGSLLFTGNTTASSLFASAFGSSAFGVGTVATSTIQGNTTGTSTIQGFVNVLGTNSTSTFSGGLAASRLSITGAGTSTAANGITLTEGCFAIRGVCVGAVSSVSNVDSTITISPNAGNVVVSLNLANANIWTGLQRFVGASTTAVSALDYVAVGRTASTTIRGETNATSTFAGGVSATRYSATATSTLPGVQLTNIRSCTDALETDAAGNVICGNDAGTDGVTVSTFGANGTWTKADYPNLSFTQVIVTAGGGGGGGTVGAAANEGAGGGGGAGGTSISMIAAGSLGTTVNAVVGGGGAAGTNAVNGGRGINSSFGTFASSTGGTGGTSDTGAGVCVAPTGVSGLGGATTTAVGDILIPGGDATAVVCATEAASGGTGGTSYWGGGGRGFGAQLAEVGAGVAGVAYGSGGGGGANVDTNNTTGVGGKGAAGVIVTMNYTSSGADLAEWYETKEDVEAGDVVAISLDSYEYDSKLGLQKSSVLEKAKSSTTVVGVVSTAPYESMGFDILSKAEHPQPIALAGRVPVKVTLENGEIKAGDLLTVSSKAGHAMRSTKAGVTIGRALEDSACAPESDCVVLVMVSTAYSTGALLNVAFRDLGMDTDAITTDLDYSKMILAAMMQQKKDITASSTLSEMLTDRLAAGLEIITPRVVSDSLVVNAIEPVERDVRIKLSDGKFVIERIAQASTTVEFAFASSTENIFAASIDALGNAIFTGALVAGSLEIGTSEKPGGITMYDSETGEPYCARIVHGRLETFAGTCHDIEDIFAPTPMSEYAEPNPEVATEDEEPVLPAEEPTSSTTPAESEEEGTINSPSEEVEVATPSESADEPAADTEETTTPADSASMTPPAPESTPDPAPEASTESTPPPSES